MDNQKERSRMDEDNSSDNKTDVSRTENRQSGKEAKEGRNISNDSERAGEGRDVTGSHQEGDYDKTGRRSELDTE